MDHYKVMARKYRPQTLQEMVGHGLTKQIIENALSNDQLSHALILTGIRGVGKTTIARIIAKSLACLNRGTQGTACGECASCQQFESGRHTDIYEMDAASHTGVDDVRAIIDTVGYQPVIGRRKVYIIDEVHMLSKNAFNALLKTLEEPPKHVCFLFATTEVHKVPDTILSRCLRINLTPFTQEEISQHLKKLCESEAINIDVAALDIIARAGQGSMRDAMSLLEQVRPLGLSATITAEQVREVLGILDPQNIKQLLELVLNQDREKALEEASLLQANGVAPQAIMNTLIELVHEKLLFSARNDDGQEMLLQRYWSILLKGLQEFKLLPMPKEVLDITLLRMMYAVDVPSVSNLLEYVKKKPVDSGNKTASASAAPEQVDNFFDFISVLSAANKMLLVGHLRHFAQIIAFDPGHIQMAVKDGAPKDLKRQLELATEAVFGKRWIISLTENTAEAMTLHDQACAEAAAEFEKAKENPLVKAILKAFPNSTVKLQ